VDDGLGLLVTSIEQCFSYDENNPLRFLGGDISSTDVVVSQAGAADVCKSLSVLEKPSFSNSFIVSATSKCSLL